MEQQRPLDDPIFVNDVAIIKTVEVVFFRLIITSSDNHRNNGEMSEEAAYGLLWNLWFPDHGRCADLNQSLNANALIYVLCNDHARGLFLLGAGFYWQERKVNCVSRYRCHTRIRGSVKKIEQQRKDMTPDERHAYRQEHDVPIWQEFMEWFNKK